MRKLSLLMIGAVVGAGSATLVSQTNLLSSTSAIAASAETYRQLSLFGDVFEKVRTDYVERPDEAKLVESARQASMLAPDTSLAFFVAGSEAPFTDLLRSSAAFPPEVRRFGIVVDPRSSSRVTETAGLPVLHLAAKEDLGGLLRWSAR